MNTQAETKTADRMVSLKWMNSCRYLLSSTVGSSFGSFSSLNKFNQKLKHEWWFLTTPFLGQKGLIHLMHSEHIRLQTRQKLCCVILPLACAPHTLVINQDRTKVINPVPQLTCYFHPPPYNAAFAFVAKLQQKNVFCTTSTCYVQLILRLPLLNQIKGKWDRLAVVKLCAEKMLESEKTTCNDLILCLHGFKVHNSRIPP